MKENDLTSDMLEMKRSPRLRSSLTLRSMSGKSCVKDDLDHLID